MTGRPIEPPIVTFSARIYQALLVAYPAKFQQEYGAEMSNVFRDCCLRAFRQGGKNGIARLWIVTLLDLIQSVISEHRQKELAMRTEMKPEDIQLAGWALMGGAAAFFVADFLLAIGGRALGGLSAAMNRPFGPIYIGLVNCLSIPLLAVGLSGIRNRYGDKVGGFGKNILLVGSILGPTLSLIGFFGPATGNAVLTIMLVIGPAVLLACLALFGIVALSRKPLPRWNIAPIVAGVGYPILLLAFIFTFMKTGNWGNGFGSALLIIISLVQSIGLVALGSILKSDTAGVAAAPA